MNTDTTSEIELTAECVEAAERTARTIAAEPEYSRGLEADIYEWHLRDVRAERRQRAGEGAVGL